VICKCAQASKNIGVRTILRTVLRTIYLRKACRNLTDIVVFLKVIFY